MPPPPFAHNLSYPPPHTHRPREKVNRPQTRRRRDNPEECLDKLRQMHDNIRAALAVVCEIIRRERRKRDLMHTEVRPRQAPSQGLKTTSSACQPASAAGLFGWLFTLNYRPTIAG